MEPANQSQFQALDRSQPAAPPQPKESSQRTKRAFDSVAKQVVQFDQAEKRDRLEAKKDERADVSLDSLLVAFQSCSVNKTHFDPGALRHFYARWRKELDDVMGKQFQVARQIQYSYTLGPQIEKLIEDASPEKKALLAFHLELNPFIAVDTLYRLAFSSLFLESFDHLHTIFSDFLPNYLEEIHQKQALVPVFALFADIAHESKSCLHELQVVLESGNQTRIEEYRVEAIRNHRPSYAKMLDLFIRLDEAGKSYCIEIFSTFAKFEQQTR